MVEGRPLGRVERVFDGQGVKAKFGEQLSSRHGVARRQVNPNETLFEPLRIDLVKWCCGTTVFASGDAQDIGGSYLGHRPFDFVLYGKVLA